MKITLQLYKLNVHNLSAEIFVVLGAVCICIVCPKICIRCKILFWEHPVYRYRVYPIIYYVAYVGCP